MIEAMAGNVLMGAEEYDAAADALRDRAAALPEQDAARLRLSGGADQGQPAGARPRRSSSAQLLRFPDDGPLHQIAARAYAAQNMRLKQHQHQGEFYAWAGNLRAAIDQLELAAKAGDGDFYQISVVETRLRKLRSEHARDCSKPAFGRPG